MILSEFGLSLFSSDHTFTHSLKEVVFLWSYSCALGGNMSMIQRNTTSLKEWVNVPIIVQWWLLPQQQRWYCYLGVFWPTGGKSSHHSGNGGWWPWYGQLAKFDVGLSQLLQLWLSAGISLVAPVLVSRGRDLVHVQLHPTLFEPTAEGRSWPVASNLYSGHLPEGIYLGRGSVLLVGPFFHFPQCHRGLVSSRNQHVCLCHAITRAGSWYGLKSWTHVHACKNVHQKYEQCSVHALWGRQQVWIHLQPWSERWGSLFESSIFRQRQRVYFPISEINFRTLSYDFWI